eukprot:m.7428 g.7428  ORF g.7428 m.7428 type:complete len:337 (+) comp5247_c0_seq1:306-1316(+)
MGNQPSVDQCGQFENDAKRKQKKQKERGGGKRGGTGDRRFSLASLIGKPKRRSTPQDMGAVAAPTVLGSSSSINPAFECTPSDEMEEPRAGLTVPSSAVGHGEIEGEIASTSVGKSSSPRIPRAASFSLAGFGAIQRPLASSGQDDGDHGNGEDTVILRKKAPKALRGVQWNTNAGFVEEEDAEVFPQRPSSFGLFDMDTPTGPASPVIPTLLEEETTAHTVRDAFDAYDLSAREQNDTSMVSSLKSRQHRREGAVVVDEDSLAFLDAAVAAMTAGGAPCTDTATSQQGSQPATALSQSRAIEDGFRELEQKPSHVDVLADVLAEFEDLEAMCSEA